MLYFPQLASGSTGQYPIHKLDTSRTIINSCLDGTKIKFVDAGAHSVQWQLRFHNLTDGELNTLQQFFTIAEGRLKSFTFLDPTSNLLLWSDGFDHSVWEKDGTLQLFSDIEDPSGGASASRIVNSSTSDLSIQQTLNVPGWFCYSFSVYARDPSTSTISLFRQSGAADSRTLRVTQDWRRFSCSGTLNTNAITLTVGVVIPAGCSVDLFGLQLEAQPSASTYKRTFSNGGIFDNAHFVDDVLGFTTTAPNRNNCTVRIITAIAG
jgi:hypothetical protein